MSNPSTEHGSEQFKPNTTVAVIVTDKNRFLLVEEQENGKTVYNQPAGHIEAGENLIDGACRELLEETGLDLMPEYCSGIYYFHRPEINLFFLRFCFVIEISTPLETSPQDEEIIATHWLSYDDIVSKKEQLRSPMVLDCINNYLAGNRIDLSLLHSNL